LKKDSDDKISTGNDDHLDEENEIECRIQDEIDDIIRYDIASNVRSKKGSVMCSLEENDNNQEYVITPELNDVLNDISHNMSLLKIMNDNRREKHKELITISPTLQLNCCLLVDLSNRYIQRIRNKERSNRPVSLETREESYDTFLKMSGNCYSKIQSIAPILSTQECISMKHKR
jgi:hypothetical protein